MSCLSPGGKTVKARCAASKVTGIAAWSETGQAAGLWRLTVENPGIEGFAPGQFMMLRPDAFGFDPLWARPFSILDMRRETVSFLIQAVGRGTAILTGLRPGAGLTLWGPLGNSFSQEPDTPTLILAGGVGLAPFPAYAARHPRPDNLRIIFGHRPPVDAYPYTDIARRITAENWREQGPGDLAAFIARLEQIIPGYAGKLVLACGPGPFLLTAKKLCAAAGARLEVSLENRMACGVGACLGCVTPMAAPHDPGQFTFVQVCTKGPVFDAALVRLEGEQ